MKELLILLNKVKIFCKKCQKYFWQRPNDHLNGHGHDCTTSKLEEKFNDLLLKNNINFKREVSFDDCRGKCRKLPFDFYLTDLDLLVEIQGEQHYLNKWGDLEERKRLDKIKRDYAMKFHNFLEIPYWQNLEKIVKHLKKRLLKYLTNSKKFP